MSQNEVYVGGIPVRPFSSIEHAVDFIFNGSELRTGAAISINPETVMLAQSDEVLREVILDAALRHADGIGVVHTMRRKGVHNTRIPGCELWEAIMEKSAQLELPVMLIGAKPEVNKRVVSRLKDIGVRIVYARDGYSLDEDRIFENLHLHQPKIVSVALGSPKQERLISKMQKEYPNALYQGVGGTFDVYAGEVRRAPNWACSMQLEWLYRLCSQPSRIFRQRNLLKYLFADLSGKL